MRKTPFGQWHVDVFSVISRGLYSFALGLSGIAIACITTLPDACEHNNLMATFSKVISSSIYLAFCSLMIGIYMAVMVRHIKDNVIENKEKIDVIPFRHYLISALVLLTPLIILVFSSIFITDFFSAISELPLNAADALAFCAEPNKPDSK
jgi:hypothetical protein